MATPSSILAWRVPWTEEPGGLQSKGLQRVRHDWSDLAQHAHYYLIQDLGLPWWLSGKEFTCQCRRHRLDPWVRKMPWRRKWQHTPVFLPGKSHEQRSLVGCSPWGHKRVGHDLQTKPHQQRQEYGRGNFYIGDRQFLMWYFLTFSQLSLIFIW